MDFNKAVKFILKEEGGYVNDPRDPGGETKYGISKRAYPKLNIKDLSVQEAINIYKKDYWDKAKVELLPDHLRLPFFDTAVNMGISTAVRILQRAGGVREDGIMGPATLAASKKVGKVEFVLERVKHYIYLVAQNRSLMRFLKGWANRAVRTIKYEAS